MIYHDLRCSGQGIGKKVSPTPSLQATVAVERDRKKKTALFRQPLIEKRRSVVAIITNQALLREQYSVP